MNALSSADRQKNAMDLDVLRAFLAMAADTIGREHAVLAADDAGNPTTVSLGPNISMFRSRAVFGVLKPGTSQEVRAIVTAFSGLAGSVSLHPYSTGRNWGLGSREPAQDNVIALDLGRLDRIQRVDPSGGWAVIEPGVTQARLAKALEGTDRILNITASSAHTSVVGNILDRGVGLRRPRVEDLLGLEVVLPGGEVVHVGWWPGRTPHDPPYAQGLGPSLLHAFVQSGFGVVTAAAVRLLPRPEALRVVSVQFEIRSLGPAVDLFRRWIGQGLTRNSLRVYDPAAAAAYLGSAGQYLAHICVDGVAEAVDALAGIVEREAAESGLFSAVWHSGTPGLSEEECRIAALIDQEYAGAPDTDDLLLTTKTGHPVDQMDEKAGLLFFLPVVPMSGPGVTHAQALLRKAADETGARTGATYVTFDADLALAVIAVKFSRGTAEVGRAHRTLERLYELFSEAGFTMCRLDVDHSEWASRFGADPAAKRLVRRVKNVLDPQHVIASGRYL